MSIETEFDLNLEIEKIIGRIERLNLIVDTLHSKSAPISTPFVVSERKIVTNQNLRTRRKRYNMDFRMRGGCGGQRGRPIANAQV